MQAPVAAVILTARLELRPLCPDDAAEMVTVLGDERLHEVIGGRPATLDELRARYERLSSQRSPDGSEAWLNWIVRRSSDGHAVGTVQATVRLAHATASIAWVVGVPWQKTGFATEAARALVAWLRDQGAVTVSANIRAGHHASEKVAAGARLVVTDERVDGERVWRIACLPAGGSRSHER